MNEAMREQVQALLEQLRFKGMMQSLDQELNRAEKKGYSPGEVIYRLLLEEWRERQERALANRINHAKIPWEWTLDTFPFQRQRSVKKTQIRSLAELSFLQRSENIVFIGPPGTGKTGLAIGLLREALLNPTFRAFHFGLFRIFNGINLKLLPPFLGDF